MVAVEPTLADFVGRAASRWPQLVAVGTAAALATTLWIRLTPPQFHAEMVVAPATTLADDAAVTAPPRAGLSPLAALSGGEALGVSSFTRFLELLTSVEVAGDLAADPAMLRRLFPDSWDAASGSWRPPDGTVARMRLWLSHVFGRPGWVPPGPEAVAEALRRRLVVDPIGATAMRRVGLWDGDRSFAIEILARVFDSANRRLRETAAERAIKQVAYLRDQISRVFQAEHRQVLIDLLARQEQHRMLVEIGLPFAADMISAPTAPVAPEWPNPVLVVPIAAIAAVALYLAVAFSRRDGRTGRA